MAPESLRCWQFTDKTAVWSFGVLLWEMFSYGLQPYCGYSNHEVLDIITRHQLLTCPDQCSAKVYSLMHECWSSQPANRPQFKVCCVARSTEQLAKVNYANEFLFIPKIIVLGCSRQISWMGWD